MWIVCIYTDIYFPHTAKAVLFQRENVKKLWKHSFFYLPVPGSNLHWFEKWIGSDPKPFLKAMMQRKWVHPSEMILVESGFINHSGSDDYLNAHTNLLHMFTVMMVVSLSGRHQSRHFYQSRTICIPNLEMNVDFLTLNLWNGVKSRKNTVLHCGKMSTMLIK